VVKIRLRRVGAKRQPSYRIVVASSTSPRDGRFLEVIGHYNPRTEPETVVVDVERSRYWLGHGAQPTEAVMRLLKKGGVFDAASLRTMLLPALIFVPSGAWVGRWLGLRMNKQTFEQVIAVLLLFSGILLIYQVVTA